VKRTRTEEREASAFVRPNAHFYWLAWLNKLCPMRNLQSIRWADIRKIPLVYIA
jgi:hypothetical protein